MCCHLFNYVGYCLRSNKFVNLEAHTEDIEDQTVASVHLNIMDQLLDTYANVEQPSAHHSKRTREIKSSENIYANVDEIHSLEPNGTGPALSGNEHMKTGIHVYT